METSVNSVIRTCLARIDKQDIYVLRREHFVQSPMDDLGANYSGYVTTLSEGEPLPLDSIANYGQKFALSDLEFHEEYDDTIEQDCFGLYSRELGVFLDDYIGNMSYFDFDHSDFPEYRFLPVFLECFTFSYFAAPTTAAVILPGYMTLLAEGRLRCVQESFRICAMIDFSQPPDTVEALKHFRLEVNGAEVRLRFGKNGVPVRDAFLDLVSRDSFRRWLEGEFPGRCLDRINADIAAILANM